jgi:hypothetical protein
MKRVIEPEEFKRLVKKDCWFVQSLRNEDIDYWDFNICAAENRSAVFAIRLGDFGFWDGYIKIAEEAELCLIEKGMSLR